MDWIKYRKIYFTLSGLMIVISIFSLLSWKLKLGLDFTGGTLVEYKFEKQISTEDTSELLKNSDVEVSSIQEIGDDTYLMRFTPLTPEDKERLDRAAEFLEGNTPEEKRYETVGPSIGPELIKKTIYAILIAAGSILIWVAIQFRSLKFGTFAIVAMFHDSFILIGAFSLLGHLFSAEVDFLFVTALLTTLSFSVHDTIVVYDRIRESQKKFGLPLYELANIAISETMVRSLNNSFTIIFMLVALILLGGITVRWFSLALFIGTLLGTYSSPFVAVPLLVTWGEISEKLKKRK